jgi:D-3-phosphoglycerate dehydrogenase
VALLKSRPDITFDIVDEVSTESYAPLIGNTDAVLLRTQPMPEAVIAAAPRLKIVSRHGVGYDAVDVAALNRRGIALAIVGDVNSRAVAEHTLMLMLAVARHTAAHDAAVRGGKWQVRNRFESTELDGKRLLLGGFGRIGRRVAELARAFGMRVAAFDPFVAAETMAAAGVEAVKDFAAALAEADYISLHMPPSPQGVLIGAAEIARMKPTAIIINAARGELIDEAALDRALREGRLGGAGLDVYAEEPPSPGNPLMTNEKVTLSPHSAGLTAECAARMAVAAVQNILGYFDGTIDRRLIVNDTHIGTQRQR